MSAFLWTIGAVLWLVGAALMLANWPFTLIVIMPTNHLSGGAPPEGDVHTRERLIAWGKLHGVRTTLSGAATATT